MKLAYADPPYLGCAKYYPDHPDSAKWDNVDSHIDLMHALDREYDGWAYSLTSTSLRILLPSSPSGVRIASWVKPFAAFKRNVRIAYTWEPIVFKPGRDSSKLGAPVGRDYLAESITLKKGLTGTKPDRFNDWILTLLGYIPGDQVDDLFPGLGGLGRAVERKISEGEAS